MLSGHRWLLLGVLSLPVLAACGSTSMGSESGSIAPTPTGVTMPAAPVTPPKAAPVGSGVTGTDNLVSATASVGALSVAVGASQTINVTFTSADGLTLTGFSVYGGLGTLPADWSAQSNLTCAAVGPGNGCVLTLTYAPTAIETGTLTLDCVYVDNAGLPRTPGPCLTLSYASSATNNVVASVSPSGEIDAALGGSKRSVNVSFSTDDGNAATSLNVTPGRPAGGVEQHGAGIGVHRRQHRQRLPAAVELCAGGRGQRHAHIELHLRRRFRRGAQRRAQHSLRHDYATARSTTVCLRPARSMPANMGGTQAVAVTFTAEDGGTADGLSVLTDLTKLPPGWSSTATAFGCASVSTGNGCQLQLKYAPTALTAGR